MSKAYTKDSIIKTLQDIRGMGWIENLRHGNDGGVGNTLEDLLEIEENNLPVPNASEWELKCQRSNTSSLTTLFHSEPSPTKDVIIKIEHVAYMIAEKKSCCFEQAYSDFIVSKTYSALQKWNLLCGPKARNLSWMNILESKRKCKA